MMRLIHQGAAAAALLACSSATMACAESESEFELDGARPVQTVEVESPEPDPTAVPRTPTRSPAREASVAAIVHGIAELQIDDKQFVPADYLRVALRGGVPVQETLTGAGGEFFFENVPPGRYQLVFRTVTKDARQVYATAVRVDTGDRVRLPPVHIPIDSVRSRK